MDRIDQEFPLRYGSPPPAQSQTTQATITELNSVASSVVTLRRELSEGKSPLSSIFCTNSSRVKAHSVKVETECY